MTDAPQTTVAPATTAEIEALAHAMAQLLDDMGTHGNCVCGLAKAHARIAFQPFAAMLEDDCEGYMSMAEAAAIDVACDR